MWLVFQVRQQRGAYVTSLHLQKLSVLNCVHVTVPLVLVPCTPTSRSYFFPPPFQLIHPGLFVSAVTWMWSLTRERWCMLKACPPQTHIHTRHTRFSHQLPPTRTYSCVICRATLSWLHFRASLHFDSEHRNIVFCAWCRQGCIELHILSFSLISMQLPGEVQMAECSLPPAGGCQHTTSSSVGATGNLGSPVVLELARVRAGHLTVTHCPGTTTDKCNKTSKECAMSSANTDTLCVWECAKLSHDDKF